VAGGNMPTLASSAVPFIQNLLWNFLSQHLSQTEASDMLYMTKNIQKHAPVIRHVAPTILTALASYMSSVIRVLQTAFPKLATRVLCPNLGPLKFKYMTPSKLVPTLV
jgi:hypothetical protein